MSADILEGLRVLDLTTTIAGPHCSRMLADLGARVVKVESPEGDLMRSRPPLRDGASSAFGQLNAGKRSVILDLKQPPAVEILKRLVRHSDLLVENYRPGVMKRLGLDWELLRPLRPDLVYCAISAMGRRARRPNCRPTRRSSTRPPATTSRISRIRRGGTDLTPAASSSPTC